MFHHSWIWKLTTILNYLIQKISSVFIKQTDTKGIVLTATQTGKKKEFNFKQLMLNF